MWGFLKCNYSYTKILIVLLSPSLADFFFPGQGDSPVRACPGSPRTGAERSLQELCAQDQDALFQGGRQGSGRLLGGPDRQPPASHRSNKTQGHTAIPTGGRWAEGPGSWPLLQAPCPWLPDVGQVSGWQSWRQPERAPSMGNALAAPVFQSAPASLLQRQPDRCFTFYFRDCSKMHIT